MTHWPASPFEFRSDLRGHPCLNLCQVTTSGRKPQRSVTFSLLGPSASPERVWLYAAELDERFARAAHADFHPLPSRQHHISVMSAFARNSEGRQLRVHPTRARRLSRPLDRRASETQPCRQCREHSFADRRTRQSSTGNAKPVAAQPKWRIHALTGQSSCQTFAQKLGKRHDRSRNHPHRPRAPPP